MPGPEQHRATASLQPRGLFHWRGPKNTCSLLLPLAAPYVHLTLQEQICGRHLLMQACPRIFSLEYAMHAVYPCWLPFGEHQMLLGIQHVVFLETTQTPSKREEFPHLVGHPGFGLGFHTWAIWRIPRQLQAQVLHPRPAKNQVPYPTKPGVCPYLCEIQRESQSSGKARVITFSRLGAILATWT